MEVPKGQSLKNSFITAEECTLGPNTAHVIRFLQFNQLKADRDNQWFYCTHMLVSCMGNVGISPLVCTSCQCDITQEFQWHFSASSYLCRDAWLCGMVHCAAVLVCVLCSPLSSLHLFAFYEIFSFIVSPCRNPCSTVGLPAQQLADNCSQQW